MTWPGKIATILEKSLRCKQDSNPIFAILKADTLSTRPTRQSKWMEKSFMSGCVCLHLCCYILLSICTLLSIHILLFVYTFLSVDIYVSVHIFLSMYILVSVCMHLSVRILLSVHILLSSHMLLSIVKVNKSRVPNQNGVSLLYIVLEIHHSGRELSKCLMS